jgi:hypothetical protein
MIEKPIHRYGNLDTGALCKLYRSEDVYIPSSDDYTDPATLMRFVDNCLASPHIYILGRDPRHEAFIFSPSHNATTFIAHFAVRKDKRDGSVVRNCAMAARWVFENTTCENIMAFVNEGNKVARSVLAQGGLTRIGKTRDSVRFGGKLCDEIIYQMTLAEFNAIFGDELGRV